MISKKPSFNRVGSRLFTHIRSLSGKTNINLSLVRAQFPERFKNKYTISLTKQVYKFK